jgi:hypothetical protein
MEQHGSLPVTVDGAKTGLLLTFVTIPDGRIIELSRLAMPYQPSSLSFIEGQ